MSLLGIRVPPDAVNFMPSGNESRSSEMNESGIRILHQYMVINGVVVTRKEWKQVLRNGEDTEGSVFFVTGKIRQS